MLERGFEPKEVLNLVQNPSYIKMQTDGAKAFIKNVADNKFNVIVVNGATKEVVTAIRHVSLKKVEKLGQNYGWSLK